MVSTVVHQVWQGLGEALPRKLLFASVTWILKDEPLLKSL